MAENIISRFWSKVDTSNGPDACWLWTASKNPDGYGNFWANGFCEKAHRFAYGINKIPPDAQVLHRCDNPPCCNPSHLFLGDHDINMADKAAKGRVKPTHGELNPRAKLTEAEVIQILQKTRNGISLYEIADQFNISYFTIWDIRNGRSWKRIPR